MNESKNPWSNIDPPVDIENVNAKRVNESLAWDLYWAVDSKQNCLLILNCDIDQNIPTRLPNFKGLRMDLQEVNGKRVRLILRLLQLDQRDLFYRLCIDIIEAIETAKTESELIQRFLNRTWGWHRLLKGIKGGLSRSELQGLIGELVFLESYLLPNLDAYSAIGVWKGPFGNQKDFEYGNVQIEVKTKNDTATATVLISSEHQLASKSPTALYLYVIEVLPANQNEKNAVTIGDILNRIRSRISEVDISSVELFENCLAAVGYDFELDYSEYLWIIGREAIYRVENEFPRITPSMYPIGVEGVRYTISLEACCEYKVDRSKLIAEFAETNRC